MPKMPPLFISIPVAIFLLSFLAFVSQVRAAPIITVREMAPKPLDNIKLIKAIRQVENWDGESEGFHGERGPSQIKMMTWRQHTKVAWIHALYRTAFDRLEYHEVECSHAAWIRDVMENRRLPQTAYTFGLFWKAGYKNVINATLKPADRDYAVRVQNIYEALIR
jgi:hypothetical protein